jgi:hypothetical protein
MPAINAQTAHQANLYGAQYQDITNTPITPATILQPWEFVGNTPNAPKAAYTSGADAAGASGVVSGGGGGGSDLTAAPDDGSSDGSDGSSAMQASPPASLAPSVASTSLLAKLPKWSIYAAAGVLAFGVWFFFIKKKAPKSNPSRRFGKRRSHRARRAQ